MKSSFILSTFLLALLLMSCDQNPFQRAESTQLGREFYEKSGLPPQIVERLSPEQLTELLQNLNQREERLTRIAAAGQVADFYEEIGLPQELALKMEPFQILEYMQLVANIQEVNAAIRIESLYDKFGLPREIADRMEPHEIIEYIQLVAGLASEGKLSNDQPLSDNLYDAYGLPKEVAERMAPHEIMEFMHMKTSALNPEASASQQGLQLPDMHHFPPPPSVLIGIMALFAFMVILLVGFALFLNYKKTMNLHDLMYHSIQEGREIPFEAMQATNRTKDFRNGMILVGLGLGLMLFLLTTHGPLMIGFIPFCIGLGYLVLSRFLRP